MALTEPLSAPQIHRRAQTFADALTIARDLFGKRGVAELRDGVYLVGTKGEEEGFRFFGRGRSWEEAFYHAVKAGRR